PGRSPGGRADEKRPGAGRTGRDGTSRTPHLPCAGRPLSGGAFDRASTVTSGLWVELRGQGYATGDGRPNRADALRVRGRPLLEEVARAVGVDRDAGAHRGGEEDLPQVLALRRRGLRPQHLVEDGRVVVDQLRLAEARLAE